VNRLYDEKFRAEADALRVAGAGTETVAPLLAMLVNLVRPRHVLEVGMGYTTPYLAGALADVRDLVAAESVALDDKSRRHTERDEAWLHDEPPLVDPVFYRAPYEPRMVAIDNLSIEDSSAGRVAGVLDRLGLADLVTVVNADLTEAIDALPAGFAPIDLAWVDAWECLRFFDDYWDLVRPGGLVAMHYLMTYPQGEAVLRYFRKFQQAHPDELEVLNLLEPHKVTQNSVTLLRRRTDR
jgi:predicted O-methyltransferase YrrM